MACPAESVEKIGGHTATSVVEIDGNTRDFHRPSRSSFLISPPKPPTSGRIPTQTSLLTALLLTPNDLHPYEKAAKQAGVKLQVKEINTFPSQDPEGVVPGIALFVLLLAGYLGSTFAMQRTKTASAHHRVLALLGHAVVAALVIDLLAGPILGAYPNVGSNFWKLWPEFALVCFAVALLAATLQSLIGTMGTLVAIILIVFIGNPSTGGGNGVAFLPPFWQSIGVVLPPRNGLYVIRNTLYFHGNSITQPIIVLAIYVLVGGVLVTIVSWEQLQWWRADKDRGSGGAKRPEVISPDEETGTAAIPPG
jgi:hypothetical protein